MEDAEVMRVMTTGDTQPIIERVDQIALDCQDLINEIAPPMFADMEALLGVTLSELAAMLAATDLEDVADETLRRQLALVQESGIAKELHRLVSDNASRRDPSADA